MGLLQFGWIAVQTYTSSIALSGSSRSPPGRRWRFSHIWSLFWAKGIRYVSKVATHLPLIPLVTDMDVRQNDGRSRQLRRVKTDRAPPGLAPTAPHTGNFGVFAAVLTYVVGYFATAGAAGVDFGLKNRDKRDVSMGGLRALPWRLW